MNLVTDVKRVYFCFSRMSLRNKEKEFEHGYHEVFYLFCQVLLTYPWHRHEKKWWKLKRVEVSIDKWIVHSSSWSDRPLNNVAWLVGNCWNWEWILVWFSCLSSWASSYSSLLDYWQKILQNDWKYQQQFHNCKQIWNLFLSLYSNTWKLILCWLRCSWSCWSCCCVLCCSNPSCDIILCPSASRARGCRFISIIISSLTFAAPQLQIQH